MAKITSIRCCFAANVQSKRSNEFGEHQIRQHRRWGQAEAAVVKARTAAEATAKYMVAETRGIEQEERAEEARAATVEAAAAEI